MAREKQDHKSTRKQKRMRPTQPKSKPNDSNRFLSLPPELIDSVVDHLPDNDGLLALILTCKTLYHRYRLRFVVDYIQTATLLTVYYLEGAREGEFGWKPFSIVYAEFSDRELADRDYTEKDEEPDWPNLTCVEHNVAEFHEAKPTRDYFIVEVVGDKLCICGDYLGWLDTAPEITGDWDSVFRGRLHRATPELLKKRFAPCPECDGSEEIVHGSGWVAQRRVPWPALCENEFYIDFEGPCPRCTYPYGYAVNYYEETLEDTIAEENCLTECEYDSEGDMYGYGLGNWK